MVKRAKEDVKEEEVAGSPWGVTYLYNEIPQIPSFPFSILPHPTESYQLPINTTFPRPSSFLLPSNGASFLLVLSYLCRFSYFPFSFLHFSSFSFVSSFRVSFLQALFSLFLHLAISDYVPFRISYLSSLFISPFTSLSYSFIFSSSLHIHRVIPPSKFCVLIFFLFPSPFSFSFFLI